MLALLDPFNGGKSASKQTFASHVGVGKLKLPAAVHAVDKAPFSV
jgi:hypothetical protein